MSPQTGYIQMELSESLHLFSNLYHEAMDDYSGFHHLPLEYSVRSPRIEEKDT